MAVLKWYPEHEASSRITRRGEERRGEEKRENGELCSLLPFHWLELVMAWLLQGPAKHDPPRTQEEEEEKWVLVDTDDVSVTPERE